MPVHIWGWADPGESVTLTLHAQRKSTASDGLGKWSIDLEPEPAGGPYTLTAQGNNTLILSDILIGDVWFASGQSNMEYSLKDATPRRQDDEILTRRNSSIIHLIQFHARSSEYPQDDQGSTWTSCTPEAAGDFSAVAYFFGQELAKREHIPIGLIQATAGGSWASGWISLAGIARDPLLMPIFAQRARSNELQVDMARIVAEEERSDTTAKLGGKATSPHPWHPNPSLWAPGGLFNGSVAPATPYTIKGVIWYQGESDTSAQHAQLYERLLPDLIADWRRAWHQGAFPFLLVQISSFTSSSDENWGAIREIQRRTLSVANTGMAVSIDVGVANNIHPPDKAPIGQRLALAARAIVYGETLEYSGPLFRQTTSEGSHLRIWLDHANGLSSRAGLVGFEIASADHHFRTADAHIEGDTVVVSAAGVDHPRYVRYAWANAPLANLYNRAGLPASTFTSEDDLAVPPCPDDCPQ